jgi:hypothetical protein
MYDDEDLSRLLSDARNGNNRALGAMLAQLRPWLRRQAGMPLGQRLLELAPDGSPADNDHSGKVVGLKGLQEK